MQDTIDPRIIVAADNASTNGILAQVMIRARETGTLHFMVAVERSN
jgi:hypothetical protein